MKCLHCGTEQSNYLCENCLTEQILDKVFYELLFFKPETCTSPHIEELVSQQTEKYAERLFIPEVINLFPTEIAEFYRCRYAKYAKDPSFEGMAIDFVNGHRLIERKTQRVLFDLLESYLRNDFIKPRKWCEIIFEQDSLCLELYTSAAQYYAMIGEYDLADQILNKATAQLLNSSYDELLFLSREKAETSIQKLKDDLIRYRTKKPYWPTTEERRRAVAMFYDEKGIKYPRIETKPAKVPENKFARIKPCFEEHLADYCSFWCSETYSVASAKCIYQIAAVKTRSGKAVETFETFVRPWDVGSAIRSAAAKEVGVSAETIESAPDVDLAMKSFFAFVGNDVLVSTGALGNQAKLISRAARYAGMAQIENEFFDLLDMAAETSSDFDMNNNTREYLLTYFTISEGRNALDKAQANKKLYDALESYGD